MKYAYIFFALIPWGTTVFAQTPETRFSVRSESGTVLSGIEVIRNGKIVAHTDDNGRVSLPDVKKGERIVFQETCVFRYDNNGNYSNFPTTKTAVFVAQEDNPPGIRMLTAVELACVNPNPDFDPTVETTVSPPAIDSVQAPDSVYILVDEPAEFPGGRMALMRFLADHLRYPESAYEMAISGKVYLQFVVEKDGSLTAVTVKRGIPDCPECDREAKRIVTIMPKWKPAKHQGRIVRSQFNLPVAFVLE